VYSLGAQRVLFWRRNSSGAQKGKKMPQYLLLLHGGKELGPNPTPTEVQAYVAPYQAWLDKLRAEGNLIDASRLLRDRRVVGVGAPASAESHDILGGYYRVRAPTIDGAEALASDCPHLLNGGWIEVRLLAGEER
jgi:hypothetical protein